MKITARVLTIILCIGFLVACGTVPPPEEQPETGSIEISAPRTGQVFSAGVVIPVRGSAPEGTTAMVSLDGGSPVAASMAGEPSGGKILWFVELPAPAVGPHSISVSAEGAEPDTVEFTVIAVADVQPAGLWDGTYRLYNAEDVMTVEDTLLVLYSSGVFRMRFGVNQILGVTDGWDLIDEDGFRMTGTYIPVGGTDRWGTILTAEKVEYYGVADDGSYSMRGEVWRE